MNAPQLKHFKRDPYLNSCYGGYKITLVLRSDHIHFDGKEVVIYITKRAKDGMPEVIGRKATIATCEAFFPHDKSTLSVESPVIKEGLSWLMDRVQRITVYHDWEIVL